MARRISRSRGKIYGFVDIPPPTAARALCWGIEELCFNAGKELTMALKCTRVQDNAALEGKSSFSCVLLRKIQLFMCAARGALGTGEAQPRGRESRGKHKGKSLAAGWEGVNCGISLPHPTVEPALVEMKMLCLRIPEKLLRILPLGISKSSTDLNSLSLMLEALT